MEIEYNCFNPSKVNVKFVYEGKCWERCLIYEVKCKIFDAIYISKTQQNQENN